MLLFLADNLVTFPYLVFEEPLFVLHNIDLTLSVTGASILQAFREVGHLYTSTSLFLLMLCIGRIHSSV